MKKSQIKGIIHDLLHLEDWKNPIYSVQLKETYEMNLLTGKGNLPQKDSVVEMLKRKSEWFRKRIKDLDGKLSDFKKAKFTVRGNKEKVEIIYKGEEFVGEEIHQSIGKEQFALRKELAKLQSFNVK